MAEPISGTTKAFMAVSVVTQAAGFVMQGQAAQRAAQSQAAVLAQQAARDRQIAEAAAEDQRRADAQFKSKRRAILGGSGVQIGTGSPLLVDADIAKEAELSAQRILVGGEVTARRREQQAQLAQLEGRGARTASLIQAGGALLRGGVELSR
jgi:hypothetical protein